MIDLTPFFPFFGDRFRKIDDRLDVVEGRIDELEHRIDERFDRIENTLREIQASDRAYKEASERADVLAGRLQSLAYGTIVAATVAIIVKVVADAVAG